MRRDLRVQFVHGLESSPQGVKARLLAEHFVARTPQMDTRDFEGSIAAQTRALEAFDPHVIVGSSYGGAILVAMIQRGVWRGPTLLIAQAALRRGLPAELPEGQDIWLVHGSRDDIIDAEDSRVLARTGTPGRVRLIEIDDVHACHTTVEDGRLVAWVEELGALAAAGRGSDGEGDVNWDAIGAVGEIVGAAAVVITLFYLSRQVGDNARQVKMAALGELNTLYNDGFLPIYNSRENMEIWVRGLADPGALPEVEREIFFLFMRRLLNPFETAVAQHVEGTLEARHFERYCDFTRGVMTTPGGEAFLAATPVGITADAVRLLGLANFPAPVKK